MHKKIVEQLKLFDTGIEDVEIIEGMDASGKTTYFSRFLHKTESDNSVLSYFAQTTGTKLLYNRLMDFFLTIDTGGILVFDEIEMHLHSRVDCLQTAIDSIENIFLGEVMRDDNEKTQNRTNL